MEGVMEEEERKKEGVIGNKMFLLKGFAGMLWIYRYREEFQGW